jgi:hypothetical protein
MLSRLACGKSTASKSVPAAIKADTNATLRASAPSWAGRLPNATFPTAGVGIARRFGCHEVEVYSGSLATVGRASCRAPCDLEHRAGADLSDGLVAGDGGFKIPWRDDRRSGIRARRGVPSRLTRRRAREAPVDPRGGRYAKHNAHFFAPFANLAWARRLCRCGGFIRVGLGLSHGRSIPARRMR